MSLHAHFSHCSKSTLIFFLEQNDCCTTIIVFLNCGCMRYVQLSPCAAYFPGFRHQYMKVCHVAAGARHDHLRSQEGSDRFFSEQAFDCAQHGLPTVWNSNELAEQRGKCMHLTVWSDILSTVFCPHWSGMVGRTTTQPIFTYNLTTTHIIWAVHCK